MSYLSSSEFVSHGHPDRLADNLAAYLIELIQEKDGPKSHAAVEVFITRDTVIFGGEVTTSLKIDDDLLRHIVKEGYKISGYIPEMRKYWTVDQVALADDMKIINKLVPQSPDIALGTTDKGEESGYNDQGVFFSSSENTNRSRLGLAMKIATNIGDLLSDLSLQTINDNPYNGIVLGPDNKVVVTVEVGDDGFTPTCRKCIKAVTIAVAHNDVAIEDVRSLVRPIVEEQIRNSEEYDFADDCAWIINGTGKFVVHGASSDTSMTGRKISVNHPSAGPVWANKMIGGGSLVKPWHASDYILNVLSRFIANTVVVAGLSKYAVVGCASAIGQRQPQSMFIKSDYSDNDKLVKFFLEKFDLSPSGIAKLFDFWGHDYCFISVVDNNFFGDKKAHPWENDELLKKTAEDLISYLKEEVK